MKVYVLSPEFTMKDVENINNATTFCKIVNEQLSYYGIEHYSVIRMNYQKCISELNNDSIVVTFNDTSDNNEDFYKVVLQKKSKILPVAFGKKAENLLQLFLISRVLMSTINCEEEI